MNKKEFLEELEEYLIGIPKSDKQEIMEDYEEHFSFGKREKRSESEIIASLGEPRQIARDVRYELSSSRNAGLKTEAIEIWVEAKRFSRSLFNEATEGIGAITRKGRRKKKNGKVPQWIVILLLICAIILILSHPFFMFVAVVLVGYLIYRHLRSQENETEREQKKTDTAKSDTEGSSFARIVLSLIFNVFFFIWFWLALFSVVLGMTIASVALMISGIMISVFAIVSLITYTGVMIKGILFSGMFSGIGIMVLGGLFFWFSKWVIITFFSLTKQYLRLNMRFIGK